MTSVAYKKDTKAVVHMTYMLSHKCVLQVWKAMRVVNRWQDVHLWLNYCFKPFQSMNCCDLCPTSNQNIDFSQIYGLKGFFFSSSAHLIELWDQERASLVKAARSSNCARTFLFVFTPCPPQVLWLDAVFRVRLSCLQI